MLPLLALWLFLARTGRARARQAADSYSGEIVNPWSGERVLPAEGGGLADPWGANSAPRAAARQTPAAARATATDSRKLSWMLGAVDAQTARSKASDQLQTATAVLIATAPLSYTSRPLVIQAAGPSKWYATLDVDNDSARGRLRAQLSRTPGVFSPT